MGTNMVHLGVMKMFQITQSGLPEVHALYLFLVAGYRCYSNDQENFNQEIMPIPMGAAAPRVESAIGCAACGSARVAGACGGPCAKTYCGVQCQAKHHKNGFCSH
jgi:hypothetical protein